MLKLALYPTMTMTTTTAHLPLYLKPAAAAWAPEFLTCYVALVAVAHLALEGCQTWRI